MENVRHGAEIVASLTKLIESLDLEYSNDDQIVRDEGEKSPGKSQRPSLPHKQSATSSSTVSLAKRITSSLYYPRSSLDLYSSTPAGTVDKSTFSVSSPTKQSASSGSAKGKGGPPINPTAMLVHSISESLVKDFKIEHKMLFSLLGTREFKAYGLEFLRDYKGVSLPLSQLPPSTSSLHSYSCSSDDDDDDDDEDPSAITVAPKRCIERPFWAATNLFWHWTLIQEGDESPDRWMEDPPKEGDFLVKRRMSQQQQQQSPGAYMSKATGEGRGDNNRVKRKPVNKLTKTKANMRNNNNDNMTTTFPRPLSPAPSPSTLRSHTGSISSIASTRRMSVSSRLRFSLPLDDDNDDDYFKSYDGRRSGSKVPPPPPATSSSKTIAITRTRTTRARRRMSKMKMKMNFKAQWDLSDHLLRFVLLCFRFVNENDGYRRHFRTWSWNLQGLFRFFLGVLRLLVVRGGNQEKEEEGEDRLFLL